MTTLASDFEPQKIEFSMEFIRNAYQFDERYSWFMEILNESVAIPAKHPISSHQFNDYSMVNMIYGA